MPPNPSATRDRIVTAAEQLFAERGIEGVSLREINTAAGQRNTTALQYHFGDRAGLLRAIVAKHTADVDAVRHVLLDQYDTAPPDDRDAALRTLTGALVRPAATKLADHDGGRSYLRIMAQLVYRPDMVPDPAALKDRTDSINRWRRCVEPLLPELTVRRLHRRYTAIRITFVELALRAQAPPARDDRLFTSHLVDLVTAVLDAPLSDETERLARRRR